LEAFSKVDDPARERKPKRDKVAGGRGPYHSDQSVAQDRITQLVGRILRQPRARVRTRRRPFRGASRDFLDEGASFART